MLCHSMKCIPIVRPHAERRTKRVVCIKFLKVLPERASKAYRMDVSHFSRRSVELDLKDGVCCLAGLNFVVFAIDYNDAE